MNCLPTISLFIPAAADSLTCLNDYLFEIINNLAGQSWIFDNLINLAVENKLVKAALIGACFIFVWLKGTNEAETAQHRKILLITLLASIFVIATTKVISKTVFLPRPFILSQKTFHLEENRLVESLPLRYRIPLDAESQKSFKALQQGEVVQNDLGSFPSDHAGFYMTLAFGLLLACRSIGLIALFWTIFVTLGSRIISGQHSPLDIAVGSGIGIGILLVFQFFGDKFGKRLIDPLVDWTLRNSAFSSAIVFIFVFEATDTLENLRPLLKFGKNVVKNLIGG